MKLLIINGPNLALLGRREPEVYGTQTLEDIVAAARARAEELGAELEAYQSDSEGALVARIGAAMSAVDALIINPAAYTHTSVALRDAIVAVGLPTIEVHLSNVQAREVFRHASLTAPVCLGQIVGLGGLGYVLAVEALVHRLRSRHEG